MPGEPPAPGGERWPPAGGAGMLPGVFRGCAPDGPALTCSLNFLYALFLATLQIEWQVGIH
jgi:hypothetical protein